MAEKKEARRCSPCDINFPKSKKECPACGKPTWLVADQEADPDWGPQVIARRKELARDPNSPLIEDLDVEPILTDDGEYLIATDILGRGDYVGEPGEIVLTNGEFYELVRPEEEEAVPAWVMEHIPVTGAANNIDEECRELLGSS